MTRSKPPSQPGCHWIDECIEECDALTVFVEDQGVRANFANPRRRSIRKIKYDGCFNKNPNELKADYIVGQPKTLDVIVELKGSDLKHARDQVESTLEKWRKSPIRFGRIVCVIVFGRISGKKRKVGQIPRVNSVIQTLRREFLRINRTLLVIRQSGDANFALTPTLTKNNE